MKKRYKEYKSYFFWFPIITILFMSVFLFLIYTSTFEVDEIFIIISTIFGIIIFISGFSKLITGFRLFNDIYKEPLELKGEVIKISTLLLGIKDPNLHQLKLIINNDIYYFIGKEFNIEVNDKVKISYLQSSKAIIDIKKLKED